VPTPITFHIYQAGQLVRSATLTREVIKLGKLDSSHLKLEDEGVSRMHAVIEVTPSGEAFVTDFGSATGTFVNGQRVSKTRLKSGDQLQLGNTLVAVEFGDGTAQAVSGAAPVRVASERAGDPRRLGAYKPVPAAAPEAASVSPLVRTPLIEPQASDHSAAVEDNDEDERATTRMPALDDIDDVAASAPHAAYSDVVYQMIPQIPLDPADIETSQAALEVAILWGDISVLHVAHVSPPNSFYVGDALDRRGKLDTQFLIGSDTLGTDRLPVVLATEAGDAALVIPQGATGEVKVSERRASRSTTQSIAELRAQQQLQPCAEYAGGYQYPLPRGASARVHYRGFTFVVKHTVAARPIGVGQHGIDWKSQSWTLASFGLALGLLLLFYLTPPSSENLSLDLLNADSRLVQYMIEPPSPKDEPEWLKPLKSKEDGGGKGQRHKDDEGRMGKQEEPKTKHKYGIQGPKDNQDPHMAREEAKQMAATAGIIGMLKTGASNQPTSPFGRDTALGNDAQSALGALLGDQVGANFGFGGLGAKGTGHGGGGNAEGTIGVGAVGTIGRGSGTGSGSGYGSGAGSFHGREAKVPRIRSATAEVQGSLSKEVIRRIINRHRNEVLFCYEQELNTRPGLQGRVAVKFIIAPSGEVMNAVVDNSNMGSVKVEQCIAQAVRRWSFPAPEGGGLVTVTYPFVFEPLGG